MLDRIKDRDDLDPKRLIADSTYGSAPMLGWLVDRKINPHIPVLDEASRTDGTWARTDFEWDAENIGRRKYESVGFMRDYDL